MYPINNFVHWSYKQESEIHNDENNGFSTHSSWAHSCKQLKCKYYVNFFYSLVLIIVRQFIFIKYYDIDPQ